MKPLAAAGLTIHPLIQKQKQLQQHVIGGGSPELRRLFVLCGAQQHPVSQRSPLTWALAQATVSAEDGWTKGVTFEEEVPGRGCLNVALLPQEDVACRVSAQGSHGSLSPSSSASTRELFLSQPVPLYLY